MNERLYRFLKWTAVILTITWVGWAAYENFVLKKQPGEYARAAGARAFSDGNYEDALAQYDEAVASNPDLLLARAGQAETLIMLDRELEAVAIFDELLALQPDSARPWANRGIALDRLGRYQQALASYEKALAIDPEAGSGPGWLTRFLRNRPDKAPAVADRARYLREQLALPTSQRQLSDPNADARQRPYRE